MNKLIYILTIITLLLIAGCSNDLPPEPETPGLVGEYFRSVGDWATAPDKFEILSSESILCAPSDEFTLSYTIDGDAFVYSNAYLWNEGSNSWDEHSISGSKVGNWIKNKGDLVITTTCANLVSMSDVNKELFVVAYSCSKVNGEWDCDGNRWQLEISTVTENTNPDSCSDSDVSNDIYFKGRVNGWKDSVGYIEYDVCSGDVLTQVGCSGTEKITSNINCDYGCANGVCIPSPDDPCIPGEEGCGDTATCYDGLKNQDETGVDCGGVCSACPPVLSGDYPDLTAYEPVSIGTAPFATDFNPPIDTTMTVSNFAPQISELIKTNNPGETLPLTAENLESNSEFFVFSKGNYGNADVQLIEGRKAAITLPSSLSQNGVYMMWPKNSNGYGKPVMINKVELWWIGPNRIIPGETFSVYGTNLILKDGDKSYIYIVELDKWLESVSANPYKAKFIMPNEAVVGQTYTIYSHNGKGGKYGWSEGVDIYIRETPVWNNNVYNVVDYGANGRDSNPDDVAFDLAFRAAYVDKGSTLYIPEGEYLFNENIVGWDFYSPDFEGNIKISGEGMGKTNLTLLPTYEGGGGFFNLHQPNGLVIEHLTIKSREEEADGDRMLISAWTRQDLTLDHIEFIDEGDRSKLGLKLQETKNVKVLNSRFIGRGGLVFLTGAEGVLFDNVTFLGGNNMNQMVTYSGSKNIDISNSFAGNIDESDPSDGDGWNKGRWIVGAGPSSYLYIGESETSNMVPQDYPWEYKSNISDVENNVGTHVIDGTTTWMYSRIKVDTEGLSDVVHSSWPNAPQLKYDDSYFYEVYAIDYDTGWLELLHGVATNLQVGKSVDIRETVDQNAGEQVLFEGLSGRFIGSPSSVTSNSVTFANLDYLTSPTGLSVVSGKGMGQSIGIVSMDRNTGIVILEKPFKVKPNTESVIAIGNAVHHLVAYDNYMDGRLSTAMEDTTASAGFQFDGAAFDVIVDGNKFHELGTGLNNWVPTARDALLLPGKSAASPNYFNIFQNNIAEKCYNGYLHTFNGGSDYFGDFPVLMGNVYRNNIASNNYNRGFSVSSGLGAGYISFDVFENNNVFNTPTSFVDNSGSNSLIFVGNNFQTE